LQGFDGVGGETSALEAGAVGSEDFSLAFGDGVGERQDVSGDNTVAADDGVAADAAELMNAAGSPDHGPVADDDVSAESGSIGKNAMAADGGVMRDVDVGHKQVVVMDGGLETAGVGAAVNGDELTNLVAMTDVGFGALALVFEILSGDTDGGVGVEEVIFANPGGSFAEDVGHEASAGAYVNFGPDDAVGADLRVGMYAGRGIDDGGGVNGHLDGRCRLLVDETAHEIGFGHKQAVHGGFCGDFGYRDFVFGDDGFHAQLIAGDNGFAEFGAFDGDEEDEFIFAIGDLSEHQDAGGLGHGLDNEDAGHNGEFGEVALKKGLIGGDILDADDALFL
jgi:hypothetical protein